MIVRLIDICLVVFLLALCAIPMVIIAVFIMIDSPGKPVFSQVRLGKNSIDFTIYKFRTMRVDAEKGVGPRWAIKDDPRITRFGSFLRKSRLDELPQLINILRGDMTFVGPRPIRRFFADQLSMIDQRYERRFQVKPGLTGYAQLFAPYGSTVQEQVDKIAYDQLYMNRPLLISQYFSVLFLTVVKIICPSMLPDGQMILTMQTNP